VSREWLGFRKPRKNFPGIFFGPILFFGIKKEFLFFFELSE
jgi:hypothetical protein